MITRIEAKQYRCFKSVNQELGPFHVLVGPNGSGKSTFLDVIRFLSAFMSSGLEKAIEERTANFHDLVWRREGNCFELAIEANAPTAAIRYELAIKIDPHSDALAVSKEEVTLHGGHENQTIIRRDSNGSAFRAETGEYNEATIDFQKSYSEWRGISVLGNVGEARFPSSAWLRGLLQQRIQAVILEDKLLRMPSPPGKGSAKTFDGSNLARLVFQLHSDSPQQFERWIAHIQTALPDLDSIRGVLRPEDKHRYLMLKYKNGVEVPAWIVSDGTLRLLALTILAYMPDFKGICLIEEPENGVHPAALETIYQSLSSVYDGQVLVTSHSPVLLNLATPEELLCFQKTDEGPEIIRGDKHPALRDWKHEV